MSKKLSQLSQRRGNTNRRCRKWVFTLNSHTNEDLSQCLKYLELDCISYIFQEEKGEEEGRLHLQGYCCFKNQTRFDTIKKKLPKAHWEVCKNPKAAMLYCQKEQEPGLRRWHKNVIIRPQPYAKLRPWQQTLFNRLDTPADNRKVLWYYNMDGNVGKTAFAQHVIRSKSAAIMLSGKAGNAKYAIASRFIKGTPTEIVMFNFVRSQEGYISYQAIEEIKDGTFFSEKYESIMIDMVSPWVIVFANFPPDESKLSQDRWEIVEIDNS